MKTLEVGIASYADMKARTMAIARGELRPKPGDPKVWFTSPESFAKVLSNRVATTAVKARPARAPPRTTRTTPAWGTSASSRHRCARSDRRRWCRARE